MGTFDVYKDSPNAIKNEGQEISLKFEKTSPTTGRISWNIPTPPAGCAADDQAYNGIIITLDTTHTSIKKSPVDGTIYVADPTIDKDLHAGDRLDTSLVIGEFYNDKTTTFLDITGLLENESYYISGYAVDSQNRYHTQGVHAYSLNQTTENSTDPTSGCQVLKLSDSDLDPNGQTGLDLNYTYDFEIAYDVENLNQVQLDHSTISTFNNAPSNNFLATLDYSTINVTGNTSQTYQELLDTINLQLKQLDNPFVGLTPPNTNAFYWDGTSLFQWDGFQHVQQDIIFENTDPTIRVVGDLWFDGTLLRTWDGAAWIVTPFLNYFKDPSVMGCTDYWFNGTSVYNFDGNIWCDVIEYVQTIDPSLPAVLDCGTFWYDETNLIINKLSHSNIWVPTDVLYWDQDPNNLLVNTLWFNDLTQVLSQWNGLTFDLLTITISATEPVTPVDDEYWYDTTNNLFFQYNLATTTFDSVNVLVNEDDPTNRESCEIWWNSATNDLFIWDVTTTAWVLVGLIESAIDPLAAPTILTGSVWINAQNEGFSWDGVQWNAITLIEWPTDPIIRVVGDLWFNGTIWNLWNGTNWVQQEVIESPTSPNATSLALNSLWFDSSNNTLQLWNGLQWVQVSYSNVPLTPINGTLWLDSNTSQLKEWFKGTWNNIEPKITAIIEKCTIKFCSTSTGHNSNIIINRATDNLFDFLFPNEPTIYGESLEGMDGVSDEPLYAQIGVGDDGSPDERRELADSLRFQLGYPTVEVELTKQQFDYCIDAAIEEIRKRTSVGYKRGFFFLDMKPAQQRYLLTNNGNGFNKIVSIQGIFRTTSSFLRGFDNGVFGQTAINFLYNAQGYDLVSYHLYSSYIEELEDLFATKIVFQWNEQTRALDIMQSGFRHERVLLDVSVERTEQDLISDRYLKPWIENWALAQSMILLSQIRGKYATYPGANGVSLNAGDLYAQAQDMMLVLNDEIDNFIIEMPEEFGMNTGMLLG